MNQNAGNVRRTAWFVLAVVAALVTPSADALSMLWVWLGAVALFELGYFAYRRWGPGGGPPV